LLDREKSRLSALSFNYRNSFKILSRHILRRVRHKFLLKFCLVLAPSRCESLFFRICARRILKLYIVYMFKKKSLGQNFLQDRNIVRDIVYAANVQPDDVVVEVGPGEGVMTEFLLAAADKVIAIEKDHRLIPFLQEKFAGEIESAKLDVLEKDILEFDPNVLNSSMHPYKIVANIPYYITGQIIRMFLESKNQPESMTLLVQKEVAERIIARDGKESLLSLSVKVFGKPTYVRTVGRGAFSPQPTVDSAVLHIEDVSKERLEGVSEDLFFSVIHAGFAHKRKQLLPNLSSLYDKNTLMQAFEKVGIGEKDRAEDVALSTWINLCKNLMNQQKNG
jgi:16S rRNA (adenine1518-N6/adenine1519-N6)-dimethyltransferase